MKHKMLGPKQTANDKLLFT